MLSKLLVSKFPSLKYSVFYHFIAMSLQHAMTKEHIMNPLTQLPFRMCLLRTMHLLNMKSSRLCMVMEMGTRATISLFSIHIDRPI